MNRHLSSRSALRPALGIAVLTCVVSSLAACGSSAATSAGSGASGAAQAKDTIVFAAVPSENSQSLKSQFENVIKLLERETGKKVQFQDATDYAAVIEGQRAGKIDLAQYGPFSYKIAKDGGVPIDAVAAGVKKEGGKPGYHSTAWTRPDTGLKSLKDFKGRKVCFVDPASTSGNLFPTAGLLGVGIDPKKDLTQVFAGAHDASLISVANKQCDAGFAQDTMMPSLISKGQLKEGQMVKVWESPTIPGSPLALNTQTLDKATQDKVRATRQEKANVQALRAAGICTGTECKLPDDATWGFVAVTDASYAPVREVCETTKADACNTSK